MRARTRKVFAYVRLTYLDPRPRDASSTRAPRTHTSARCPRTRVTHASTHAPVRWGAAPEPESDAGAPITATNVLTLRFRPVHLPPRLRVPRWRGRGRWAFSIRKASGPHSTSHGYLESTIYTLSVFSAGATTRHAMLVAPRAGHANRATDRRVSRHGLWASVGIRVIRI